MAVNITLYAWAVPSFRTRGMPHHTWVTTYDAKSTMHLRLNDVIAAKQFYWPCWGEFHPRNKRSNNSIVALGSQGAVLEIAKCYVEPNAFSQKVYSARGTIFIYGLNGVCHQLANQVLYASKGKSLEALTVAKAGGYMYSVYLYGMYGIPEDVWRKKIAAC